MLNNNRHVITYRFSLRAVLSVLLVICMVGSVSLQACARPTNASIKEKQDKVSQAKEEISGLQSGLSDVKKIKEELEQSKNDLNTYITDLDAQLTEMTEKIDEYNQLIEDKEAEIQQAELDLEEAEETQKNQYEAMKKRIKFLYETGDTLYVEMILSAGSFSDMINKADYVEMLSEYDRNKLDEYVAATEYVEACKEELEAEKEVLDEAKKDVEVEQENVNELLAEKEQQVNQVSAEISDKEAEIKAYENDIATMNAEVASLEKAIEAEIAALEASSQRQYNGGKFAWPCPSYTRISDDYGNRIHPTLGVEKFHNGIDLAAPYGSAVLAAYDGDVAAAGYSSTMGNYIMINHGSGILTIYMHCSALYVSKGQSVTKGQKIGAVGSTGRSTGNHLHFSVRQNGSYISPWTYLQ